MRTLLIVILAPDFNFLACVTQAGEPVGIQAFVSQPAVEALHVGVLDRLARLDKLQSHSAFFTPGRQRPSAKLRPFWSYRLDRSD